MRWRALRPIFASALSAIRDLTIATATDNDITTMAVVCLECGATGPKGTGGDPPGHVEYMWNQRFGADQ